MNYAADVTKNFEREQRAQALMALAVSRDSRWSIDPLETFCHKGFARYASYAKAAIDAVTAEDAAAGLAPLNAAFIESVNRTSILGQLGALEIPFDQTGRIDTSTMTAQIVDETTMKPVTGATVTVSGPPVKAVAQLVVTAELLRSTSPQMQEGLTRALVSAVAAAVDAKVISVLTSGAPAASADVGVLLASVSGGAPARPIVDRRIRHARAARAHARRPARARRDRASVRGGGGTAARGGRERPARQRRRRRDRERAARQHDNSTTAAVGRRADRIFLASEPRVPPRGAMVFDCDAARCGGVGGGRHTMSGEPDPTPRSA